MFFKNFKVWETELAGRKLTLETGKMAGLANAAVMARYGETEVLCTVTASAKPWISSRFPWILRKNSIPWAESPVLSSAVRAEQAKRLFLLLAVLTAPSVPFSPRI